MAKRINHMDAHHKLYISLAALILTFLVLLRLDVGTSLALMIAWITFVSISLLLSWITILTSHPSDVKYEAHAQDSSRTLVFCFVVAAVFASLLAIIILLKGTAGKSDEGVFVNVLVPLSCVAGSWWLLHTVFTLRYAHFFYCDMDHDGTKHVKPEGLNFPEDSEPDYMDFTYFSFVIGMTFQVSDVEITSKRIRRLAWMHGVLSFAFNTFIVAFTINIIASLFQK
ncbi:DUF1345 domain-containing protein [Emticicia sp. TH156]|nr:DUF1345 domain-containing protein [Emticicia sp. TH156]